MSDGTKTAVDLAVAQAAEAGEPEGAEQFDLLGMPSLSELQESMVAARRGPGRPKGARNRRTTATVDYLLARHTMPLEGLLSMAEMGVDELAKRLKCSPLEAWQEKRLCWAAALPYCHQRQAIAVDVTSHGMVQLVVEASPEVAALINQAGAGEGAIIDMLPLDDDDDTGRGDQ
jgi:hypothetical protein